MNIANSNEKSNQIKSMRKALPKLKTLKNTQGAARLGGQASATPVATSAGVNCTQSIQTGSASPL